MLGRKLAIMELQCSPMKLQILGISLVAMVVRGEAGMPVSCKCVLFMDGPLLAPNAIS